ncbi:MAG: kinase-like domain-containing protein [Benjaminiella poitrasii]|nr:MAG: kinase-like domain-containing protein [Benjaminiella poitrasii]
MRSLAGYSIACYVLQIKDRHNGNLLIDDAGHLIHIDFGFMLSNSPGSVGFEMAPFKLPQEYIDILGGVHGEKFAEYKALMKAAFLAVRKHSENILLLTEMMSKDSNLPCFQNGDLTVSQLRDRFQLQLTEPQAEEFVDRLIMSSCCNVFTRLYDTFQYYSQVRHIYCALFMTSLTFFFPSYHVIGHLVSCYSTNTLPTKKDIFHKKGKNILSLYYKKCIRYTKYLFLYSG